MLQVELFNDNLQGEYVITLKEITDLIGARHNDAMRKVEELSLEDGFGSLRKTRSQYESGKGRIDEIDTYIFTKKQAIAVGARLNTTMLMKVINRLEELELQKPKVMIPQTYADALRAYADEYEAKQLAISQRDEAIDQRLWISNKREATAMATASKATREVKKLEAELDKSKEYCTIKRMSMLTHGQKYSFKLLKDASNEMELPTIPVFDANYGTVKAYHKDVWLEVYGLEF